MTAVSEDLFAIPVGGRFVLCSPLRGFSALVNRTAVDRLAATASGAAPPAARGEIGELAALALAPPPPPPSPNQGSVRPCFLGLIPTRACNGACRYCDFGAGQAPADVMEPAVARQAVDWLAEIVRSANGELLEVHLFGGEPFLAKDWVKAVAAHTRACAEELGVASHLEASTNGVHDEALMRWVGESFDAVVLSLDGPAQVHDRQRPLASGHGSHRAAVRSAEILSRARAKLCLRTCITQHNVDHMAEIAACFASTLGPQVVNFETVNESDATRAAGIFAPSPLAFARGFAAAHAVLARAGIEAACASLSGGEVRHTLCPLGRDAVMVCPDGTLAGCYLPPPRWRARGLDLGLGQASATELWLDPAAIARLRRLVLDKPRCERCFCRWTCAGGCHVDVTYPGCAAAYPPVCIQTRALSAWQLLARMGRPEDAAALLASDEAMQVLAAWPSDRLTDWEAC
jgi:uncharacterized protein